MYQGRISTENCHIETEVANPTINLTQSQYTDTGLTIPSADPIMPGASQGNHLRTSCEVTGMIWYLGFMGSAFFFFNCLVGCLNMIVWTSAVLGVL